MRIAFLLALIISLSFSKETYLSQETIDETVQQAFYGFIAASKEAGGKYTQKTAIQNAQETVAKLKKIAKNDPNQRYILWRVSELEKQIALEKEEMTLKEEYKKVKEINRLVSLFNPELKKEYPSFAKLHALYHQVDNIDALHGNDFAENINQKNTVVVQQIRDDMRSYLSKGDYQKAEELYGYAVKNRRYLNLSANDYKRWRDKIEAKKNADFLMTNIDKNMKYLSNLIKANRISEARRNVDVIRRDIESARSHLSPHFIANATSKLYEKEQEINKQEEYLLNYANKLIQNKKYDEALKYLDSTLRPAGVNTDKIAVIDREIILKTGKISKNNKEVNQEIAAIQASTSSPLLSASDLNKSIKAKADSLQRYYKELEVECREDYKKRNKALFKEKEKEENVLAKNRAKADKIVLKADKQNSSGKPQKALSILQKNQDFILQYGTPSLYIDVKKDIDKALSINSFNDTTISVMASRKHTNSKDIQENKAIDITTKIYEYLGNKDIDNSAQLFYLNEELLREYTYKEAFKTLSRTIAKEYKRKYDL